MSKFSLVAWKFAAQGGTNRIRNTMQEVAQQYHPIAVPIIQKSTRGADTGFTAHLKEETHAKLQLSQVLASQTAGSSINSAWPTSGKPAILAFARRTNVYSQLPDAASAWDRCHPDGELLH
jgi:hypothetical protein